MIFDRRIKNRISENDKGSTLITVIVAIAFVTILTSVILGTTAVNVRMKGIDKRTKDDFYYAEKSLNDIYTGIGQELARIAGKQYELAFNKVGTVDGEYDYNLAEAAERDFREQFMKEAYSKVVPLRAKDAYDRYVLEGFILDSSRGTVESVGDVEYQKGDGTKTTLPKEAARVAIKDVSISVEDDSHFRSTITTDIIITTPTVDFLGTNADITDYGLIANKGLYIEGNAEINGNVYAGVHGTANGKDGTYTETTDKYARAPVYGGINIKDGKATFSGNYIISKGDINLAGSNPQIKVNSRAPGDDANLANLWFTSLRTITNKLDDYGNKKGATITKPSSDPTIDLNANVFALNDLALNADNSSVVIKGNYYGYNEGGLADILGKKDGRVDGENSAIIVNGSNAYIDMRDINNFVLMGKAYIDFTTGSDTDADALENAMTADPSKYYEVVPTAESVALKTNQQLYLVPTDFLDGPNPAQGDNSVKISDSAKDLIKGTGTDDQWFGLKYLDYGSDITNPDFDKIHQKYEVAVKGSVVPVYYDYLVFDDTKAWDESGNQVAGAVGTGGSVSSKARFFLDIMTSKSTYDSNWNNNVGGCNTTYPSKADYIEAEENKKVQPSAYRLYERIDRSMSNVHFFNLSQCVVGNSAAPGDAHYYAKNAVINYERDGDDKIQSNVLSNTDGMLRYAGYAQNLYHRYIFLCTKLDGKENKLLDAADIGTPDMSEWKVDYADSNSAAPMCHYVKISNIGSMTIANSSANAGAAPDNLKPTAFGVCVATTGNLTLSSVVGSTFKGIAIVDGDIIVPKNLNVDGLLMATGTITLEGNNKINYDKGLIQSRIEKEMSIVKNKKKNTSDKYKGISGYKDYYVISYLSKDVSGSPKLIYDVEPGSRIYRDQVDVDYTAFMHYENWQKGEK